MVCGCGAELAKFLLCTFNFLWFLYSLLQIGTGIWLLTDKNSFTSLTHLIDDEQLKQYTSPEVLNQAAYILLITGTTLFIISFLGYCGACLECRLLLYIYATLLILILVLEAVAGGLAIAYKSEVEKHTHDILKYSLTKYYASPDKADAVTLMWDHIMKRFSCCGVDNYHDFDDCPKWISGLHSVSIPVACCKLEEKKLTFIPKDPLCPTIPNDLNSNWKYGCYDAILIWIHAHSNLIIACTCGLGLLELIAIFLAYCLIQSICNSCMR